MMANLWLLLLFPRWKLYRKIRFNTETYKPETLFKLKIQSEVSTMEMFCNRFTEYLHIYSASKKKNKVSSKLIFRATRTDSYQYTSES